MTESAAVIRSRRLQTGVLAGAIVLAVILSYFNHRSVHIEQARGQALRTGVQHVQSILSYTPTTVLSDLAHENSWLTGKFANEYPTLVRRKIAPAASKGKVTVRATVVASGVERAAPGKVVLLMFVNAKASTPKVTTPQLTGSRVRVVMVRSKSEWKITSFTPLGGAKFGP